MDGPPGRMVRDEVACVHFVPGPSVVIARRDDDRPTRWCFRCRKHLVHTQELLDDPPERQPSYCDPIWVRRCARCGQDRTQFPGTDFY